MTIPFDPKLADDVFGESRVEIPKYTKIGFESIKFGRVQTIITIVHEEVHHRLAARGWEFLQLENYAERVAQRFARMIGWRH